MTVTEEVRKKFEEWARSITADRPLSLEPCRNKSCGNWFHYSAKDTAWAFSAFEAAYQLGVEAMREAAANVMLDGASNPPYSTPALEQAYVRGRRSEREEMCAAIRKLKG